MFTVIDPALSTVVAGIFVHGFQRVAENSELQETIVFYQILLN